MIVSSIARMLIREHLYKPITGKVLTLGRQTIAMTYEEVLEVMRQEGYFPSQNVLERTKIEYDQSTRVGEGYNFLSDISFFQLFGVTELASMDVTNYEHADIIHNLNYPIPQSLSHQFDFIIDGGTFDHFFDVKIAFENVVKMLNCNGRILQWNAASNFTGGAYLSLGPDLFHDYYVLNKFADCKVYIVEVDTAGQPDKWDFYEFDGSIDYGHFKSNRLQMSFVLAEKSEESTWDKMPVQRQYRNDLLNSEFNANLKSISTSNRHYFNNIKNKAIIREKEMQFVAKIVDIKHRIPKKWKKLIPMNIKKAVNNNLRLPIKGFVYVGRV